MDKARFDKGLEVRTAVLGKDYVEASMKNADDFNRPFQELVTEYCWGAAWGSDGLSRKSAPRNDAACDAKFKTLN